MSLQYKDERLIKFLNSAFGQMSKQTIELLRQHTEWVSVAGGDTLMTQGDAGDSMYLTISGRLRVYVVDAEGDERVVGELVRGQIIGEMSMYTHEPRSATVVAIRNSVLVRLARDQFNQLLATSPEVSIRLTRQIIGRLQNMQMRPALSRPVAICLLPVTDGVDALTFTTRLAGYLTALGRVKVVTAASVDAALQIPGIAQRGQDDAEANRRVLLYLDTIEAAYEFVLLVGDDGPTPWTQRCSRSCDEVLLLADGQQAVALHPNERECLMLRTGRSETRETLVLLHDAQLKSPKGTRDWLARRPVSDHFHIRPALERDMQRLARILSGTAIGLVMAGGGARGFAHLGVMRALQEQGIEYDFVGGTSMGSVMAVLAAGDRPLADVMRIARSSFLLNPTGDFNYLPVISLVIGRRLKKILIGAISNLTGHDADIEDLWKNFYCVATNYSQAREQVVSRGPLLKAILASIAIPGALPPVLMNGDLMCDGATFNNFPVDVMRRRTGVGKVIGVDLNSNKPKPIDLDDIPSHWSLLRDKFRPKKARKYRLPSVFTILMNSTLLYSTSRQRESLRACDLYFNPPLDRVGLMEWDKFDPIVQQGYVHGQDVLKDLPTNSLLAIKSTSTGVVL